MTLLLLFHDNDAEAVPPTTGSTAMVTVRYTVLTNPTAVEAASQPRVTVGGTEAITVVTDE